MPTYSYRCRDCDVAFDIQQSFDEDSLTDCPQCGGGLRKLFNTVGVVFKGSGFYRTDSRAGAGSSGGSGNSSSSGSGSNSSGGGSGSGWQRQQLERIVGWLVGRQLLRLLLGRQLLPIRFLGIA